MDKVSIEKLELKDLSKRNINNWPIWEKEVSKFDWHYDSTEECFILEGEVIVSTDDGDFEIRAGDFVTFQKGLSCVWDIKKSIRKHYNFL